jgi:hypothetical protein
MRGYVIHREPQILVFAVHLPFSKTMTQDMPHSLTTYPNSKDQPLPLHTNLHTDIMLLYQVLCSYFPEQQSGNHMGKSETWLAAFRRKIETYRGSGQYLNTLHRWSSNQYTTQHPTAGKVVFSTHEYTNHYTIWYSMVGCCNSTSCTHEHTQYSTYDNYWLL